MFSRGEIHHNISHDIMTLLHCCNPFTTQLKPPDASIQKKFSAVSSSLYPDRHTLLVPFARTAFYCTLRALDPTPGSRYLTTPVTIYPYLDISKALDLQPVFIDIELETFSVDTLQLEQAIIQNQPSCFLLTYLFGLVPDIAPIAACCRKHDVFLIEDFSQAIGAKYAGQLVGNFGDVSIYSASITKFVDAYNGGFITIKSQSLFARISELVSTFTLPSHSRVRKIVFSTLATNILLSSWGYIGIMYPLLLLVKTFHRPSYLMLVGPRISSDLLPSNRLPSYYFESITSLQATQMLYQLSRLESVLRSRRQTVENVLSAARVSFRHLPASQIIDRLESLLGSNSANKMHVFWQFPIKVKSTSSAQAFLLRHGIETGSTNLPLLPDGESQHLYPNASSLKYGHVFVPMHKVLSSRQYSRFFSLLLRAGEL